MGDNGRVLLAFASVPMALSGTTIAVPAIARDLGGGGFALTWVVTGYFLTASALMLVTGVLADIVGRRRMFGIGAGSFGLGDLGSALSVGHRRARSGAHRVRRRLGLTHGRRWSHAR